MRIFYVEDDEHEVVLRRDGALDCVQPRRTGTAARMASAMRDTTRGYRVVGPAGVHRAHVTGTRSWTPRCCTGRTGGRTRLSFEIAGLDQTDIGPLVAQFHAVPTAFPVVGTSGPSPAAGTSSRMVRR